MFIPKWNELKSGAKVVKYFDVCNSMCLFFGENHQEKEQKDTSHIWSILKKDTSHVIERAEVRKVSDSFTPNAAL